PTPFAVQGIVIIALIGTLVACSSKKENPTPQPTPIAVTGTWRITSAIDYGGDVPYTVSMTDCDKATDYTFTANGGFSVNTHGGSGCKFVAADIVGGSYTNVLQAQASAPTDEQKNIIISSKQILTANDSSGNPLLSQGPVVFTNDANTAFKYYTDAFLLTMQKQ